MVNDRTPLFLTVLAAALFIVGLLIFQPYSADWPASGYSKVVRRYIRAALQNDSLRLTRLSASQAPVTWALHAARVHTDSLKLWASRIEAWTGERSGDTTEVFVYPSSNGCSNAPIRLRFVGVGSEARVLSASSSCFDSLSHR
jgi:hypothetical protein